MSANRDRSLMVDAFMKLMDLRMRGSKKPVGKILRELFVAKLKERWLDSHGNVIQGQRNKGEPAQLPSQKALLFELAPELYKNFPSIFTKSNTQDQDIFEKNVTSKWTSGPKAKRRDAFAIYLHAHHSSDRYLNEAAQELDKMLLGKPFRKVFKRSIPRTLAEFELLQKEEKGRQAEIRTLKRVVPFTFGAAVSLALIAGATSKQPLRYNLGSLLTGTHPPFSWDRYTPKQANDPSNISATLFDIGLSLIKAEAQRGHYESLTTLDYIYSIGHRVKRDPEAAFTYAAKRAASPHGCPVSLAFKMETGFGTEQSGHEAQGLYDKVLSGNYYAVCKAQAYVNTSWAHWKGSFREYNPALAMKQLEFVPELVGTTGPVFGRAQNILGLMMKQGASGYFDADIVKAEHHFESAMNASDIFGAINLADLWIKNDRIEDAADLLSGYVNNGNAWALERLGDLHRASLIPGTSIDSAVALYEQALRNGSEQAALSLIELLLDGNDNSIITDYAINDLATVVESGNDPWAARRLGWLIFNRFMEPNRAVWAERLYIRAAELGDARAKHLLGRLYHFGWIDGRDTEDALPLFEQAAEKGDLDSKTRLAIILLDEREEPVDKRSGLKKLREAIERDHVWAMESLLRAEARGDIAIENQESEEVTMRAALLGNPYAGCRLIPRAGRSEFDAHVRLMLLAKAWETSRPTCAFSILNNFDTLASIGIPPASLIHFTERSLKQLDYPLELIEHPTRRLFDLRQDVLLGPKTNFDDYFLSLLEDAAGLGAKNAPLDYALHLERIGEASDLDIETGLIVSGQRGLPRAIEEIDERFNDKLRGEPELADWLPQLVSLSQHENRADYFFLIGRIYDEGLAGAHQDYVKAEEWFWKAAKKNGYADRRRLGAAFDARLRLVRMALDGRVREPSVGEAFAIIESIPDFEQRVQLLIRLLIFSERRLHDDPIASALEDRVKEYVNSLPAGAVKGLFLEWKAEFDEIMSEDRFVPGIVTVLDIGAKVPNDLVNFLVSNPETLLLYTPKNGENLRDVSHTLGIALTLLSSYNNIDPDKPVPPERSVIFPGSFLSDVSGVVHPEQAKLSPPIDLLYGMENYNPINVPYGLCNAANAGFEPLDRFCNDAIEGFGGTLRAN